MHCPDGCQHEILQHNQRFLSHHEERSFPQCRHNLFMWEETGFISDKQMLSLREPVVTVGNLFSIPAVAGGLAPSRQPSPIYLEEVWESFDRCNPVEASFIWPDDECLSINQIIFHKLPSSQSVNGYQPCGSSWFFFLPLSSVHLKDCSCHCNSNPYPWWPWIHTFVWSSGRQWYWWWHQCLPTILLPLWWS